MSDGRDTAISFIRNSLDAIDLIIDEGLERNGAGKVGIAISLAHKLTKFGTAVGINTSSGATTGEAIFAIAAGSAFGLITKNPVGQFLIGSSVGSDYERGTLIALEELRLQTHEGTSFINRLFGETTERYNTRQQVLDRHLELYNEARSNGYQGSIDNFISPIPASNGDVNVVFPTTTGGFEVFNLKELNEPVGPQLPADFNNINLKSSLGGSGATEINTDGSGALKSVVASLDGDKVPIEDIAQVVSETGTDGREAVSVSTQDSLDASSRQSGTIFVNAHPIKATEGVVVYEDPNLVGPFPQEIILNEGTSLERIVHYIDDQTKLVLDDVEWALGELLDDAHAAVTNLGEFITEQISPFQDALLGNEALSQSVGQFFGQYGRELLAGEMDADEAIIEFAKIHVRNATGRTLSDGLTALGAIDALEETFTGELLGIELSNPRAFAEGLSTAFTQMALSFAIDSSGWDTSDYAKAGLSILASNVTSYAVIHQIGSIFGQELSQRSLFNGQLELTPAGSGVVAAATALIGGLLEGQELGDLALSAGVAGATTLASAAIAQPVAHSVAISLLNSSFGSTLGLTAGNAFGIVSSAIVPVIGIAIGFIAGELIGDIVGGKEYEPHEYETLQQLRDSEYVITEENGERLVIATSPDGTTIKLYEHQSQVAIGGPGADTLAGSDEDDSLFGDDGNDFLDGRTGNDELIGGDGEDHIEGRSGDDFVQAGSGNDIIYGGTGKDFIDGNENNDLIHGGEGDDAVIGSDGADVLYGNDGNDQMIGDYLLNRSPDGEYDQTLLDLIANYTPGSGTRDDFVDAGIGDDYVRGGEGDDVILGGPGDDVLDGERENDDIFGDDGNDQIFGGSGSDFIHGGAGIDIVQGDAGDDFLLGGSEIDFLTGGIGHDVIDGGDDGDTIIGEVGDDILYGGEGDDSINGGYGRDILIAGEGTDLLEGEEGDDVYLFSDGDGVNTVVDTAGINDVYLMDAAAEDVRLRVQQNDLIIATTVNGLTEVVLQDFWLYQTFDTLHFSDGKQLKLDRIAYPIDPETDDSVSFRISAEASDAVVNIEQELQGALSTLDDRMSVNASNPYSDWYGENYETSDYVIPDTNSYYNAVQAITYKKKRGKYGGHYTVVGKTYPDLLVDIDDRVVGSWWGENIIGTDAAEAFYGNNGKDILEPGGGNDLAFGGAGDDQIFGGDGHDYLVGGSGNDMPVSGQAGNDTLFGSGDDDVIIGDDHGQAYDDVAYGGEGDDIVLGRGGADLLHGDSGNDRIQGGDGRDVIVGGDGNDILIGDQNSDLFGPSFGLSNGDSDIIYGGAGDDKIYAEVEASRDQTGHLGIGNDETEENYLHAGEGDDEVHGGYGDDTIFGGGGKDYILASKGNDWAHGGDGNDVISGNEGDDVIYGGDEDASDVEQAPIYFGQPIIVNDLLLGGLGSDYIYGGKGSDRISGDEHLLNGHELWNLGIFNGGNDFIYGGEGDDSLSGDGGDDYLNGGEGNDGVFGGHGNDEIYGGAGDDVVYGDGQDPRLVGNDIVSGGHGRDLIYGGRGNDTVSFLDQITEFGISAFIFDNTGFGAGHVAIDVNHANLSGEMGVGTWEDTFWEVENLIGSHGNDRLWGNSQINVFYGEGGDDILHGGEGDDHLDGGDGIDMASYAITDASFVNGVYATLGEVYVDATGYRTQNDTYTDVENLLGTKYDDLLGGNEDANALYGDAGSDNIKGGAGNDEVFGDQGNDFLHGNEGDDLVYGGEGHDYIEGNEGNDELFGWIGNDTINGGSGDDKIYGDDGNDQIAGGSGIDLVFGGSGMDQLWGNAGNDTINGDAGDDIVAGEDGDDWLYGGDGNDTVYGGAGEDFLLGDAGDDILSGEADDDHIFGYVGNDFIYGGQGNDQLAGEGGNDTIAGDDGDDVIYGDGPNAFGHDMLYGGNGNDIIRGNDGNDIITGDAGQDDLYGDDGDDEIYGGIGDDSINGGRGDDILNGGQGNDSLLGYQGNDLLVGGAGNDKLYGLSGDDNVQGGVGADTIFGDEGADALSGGSDDDWISGWHGDDEILGGEGNDILIGENDNDTLHGGDGNDVLYGDRDPSAFLSTGDEDAVMDYFEESLGYRNFGLIYQGEKYTIEGLMAADHEMLIINPASVSVTDQINSENLWTASDISDIKNDGKALIGYLNVSKINTFTNYWDQDWLGSSGTPTDDAVWLQTLDPNYQNTWLVNFWEPEWQSVLENRIDGMIDQGFDGIFLDDVLEYFFRRGSSADDIYQAAREMRDLVVNLHSFAEQKMTDLGQDPDDFQLIVNGAPYLLFDANEGSSEYGDEDIAYFEAVDAVLAENYVSLSRTNPSYGSFIQQLQEDFVSRDVAVLALDGDQVTQQQQIETMKLAVSHGFLPFATENQKYDTLNDPLEEGYGEIISNGNDTLYGGEGDDILHGGEGADRLVGDGGFDTGSYEGAMTGVLADLAHPRHNQGDSAGDTFQSIENLRGSDHDDTLFGDYRSNVLSGLQGDDFLDGGANDTSHGDFNSDGIVNVIDLWTFRTQYGQSSDPEDEFFEADFNQDGHVNIVDLHVFRGQYGKEVEIGDDVLYGHGGNDTLRGGLGNDQMFGGNGNDFITGGLGADTITGGDGLDRFVYEQLSDSLSGVSDMIRDFHQGQDIFDVGALGFSELRKSEPTINLSPDVLGYYHAYDNTVLWSTTGFEAVVAGNHTLESADFIFAPG